MQAPPKHTHARVRACPHIHTDTEQLIKTQNRLGVVVHGFNPSPYGLTGQTYVMFSA